MTIYTDPVTGKQYDRIYGGVAANGCRSADYKSCSECAFSGATHNEECIRAVCKVPVQGKVVGFVFKERAA